VGCSHETQDIGKWKNDRSNVLYSSGDYQGSMDMMTACHADSTKMIDLIGAALCSRTLAYALYQQSKYDEATDTVTMAKKLFIEISDENGAMQCNIQKPLRHSPRLENNPFRLAIVLV
jgi:hypothetical protein